MSEFLWGAEPRDDISKWERIVKSCPSRAISTLKLVSPDGSNKWGDTRRDLFPLLNALFSLQARGLRWAALVREGVIEALCEGVRTAHVEYHPPPGSSYKPETSSYYLHFSIIYTAGSTLSDPLTQIDRLTLIALKRHWRAMVKHFWEHPEKTLIVKEPSERTMFAELVRTIVKRDPSFLSIIEDRSDLTIPLLIRYFCHSKDESDVSETTMAFCTMLGPGENPDRIYSSDTLPMIGRYRKTHPAPRFIHELVLKGADQSSDRLLTKLASNLRIFTRDIGTQTTFLSFISILHQFVDMESESSLSFIRSLHRCGPFWKQLWRMIQVPQPEYFDVHIIRIYEIASKCIHISTNDKTFKREESSKLVTTWLRNGFLDALDDTLPKDFPECKVALDVGVVIGDMYEVMTHPDILPSFLPILRRELPRPRVLHALLRFAHFEEKDNPRLKQFPGVVARHVTMGQCAWRMWYALERASFVHRRCMRRGCTRTSRFRCKACRSTMYCGFDCQTMDWAEHRLLCGLYDEFMESIPVEMLPQRHEYGQFLHPDLLRQFMDLEKQGFHPPEEFEYPEGDHRLPFRFDSLRKDALSAPH